MQFSLRTLLLFFVVIWSSMATFGVWGILVTAVLAYVTFSVRRRDIRIAIIVGLGIVWLVGSLGPHSHREARRRSMCLSNLKQLGIALHNYHDHHGRFPPVYIADAEGRPMHSWRVLLLPYLEGQAIYSQYRFDEPWDGPNNRKLARHKPYDFRCLTTEATETGSPLVTHYVAVTGQGTAWPGTEGSKLKDFHDGTSKTILLVEIDGSDINWMEPRDVTLDEALAGKPYEVPSSNHFVERMYFFSSTYSLIGGNVLMADGSGGFSGARLSYDQLAALLSIDGGETLNPDEINKHNYGDSFLPGIDEARLLGFFIYVITMTMLVSRPIFNRPLATDVDTPEDGES